MIFLMKEKGSVLVILLLGAIIITGVVFGIRYLESQKDTSAVNNNKIITSPTPSPASNVTLNEIPQQNTNNSPINVKVVNGDIVIVNNDKESKITSWGYNSNPLLSPDSKRVAYLSKSKESLENEKIDKGYKRTSTNVWVIDADGSNPIQITQHKDFVYRGSLYWLDNDRLLFVDGEQSVRIYNLANRSVNTLLGPTAPVPACLDACGYEIRFFVDTKVNNPAYLLRVVGGNYPDVKTSIINLKTLQVKEIPNQFYINFDKAAFGPESFIFEGSKLNQQNNQKIQIILNTGSVIFD